MAGPHPWALSTVDFPPKKRGRALTVAPRPCMSPSPVLLSNTPPEVVAALLACVLVLTCVLLRRKRGPNKWIDTHVHLWSEDSLPPWLSDPALAEIAVTQTPADHAAAAGPELAWGIYMEVDVAPEKREEEAKLASTLAMNPRNSIAGAVIGAPIVDGTVAEFEAYARRWASKAAIKGVRQVLHTQPTGTCLRAEVVEKAKLCGELDLVFELCMRCDELTDAAMLASRAPKTRFVVDHCGGHHQLTGQPSDDERKKKWEAGIAALARLPNVWCKLSGLLGAQGGAKGKGGGAASRWTTEAQLKTMRVCLQTFSPTRLVVGGDWPVCTLTAPLSSYVRCVHELLEEVADVAARAKILRTNAEEVYRI